MCGDLGLGSQPEGFSRKLGREWDLWRHCGIDDVIIITSVNGILKPKETDHNCSSSSSASHKPTALITQAEPATITPAKTGGTNISSTDRLKNRPGKQKISDGISNGSLTEPGSRHARDDGEAGRTVENTKATSGVNDATATVTVRTAVHAAA
ncbi:KxYKxGKxW signal domain protein [Striga asiatica]|uniref:KxYKxGKxW signal domain protein n=1 Tax=Striga asiatica TaxID=4170 RepID=A0A5A7P771_STRAF|nr:KxYKxGKxW signal domain protein [Striga asiatica]